MPNQPSAQGEQPPPDLPAMPDVPNTLSNYLRSFSLWCRNGFRDKMPLNSAAPGVMLQAYDAPPGTPPNVFEFEVSQAGVAALAPVSLGGGVLGTPVPITANSSGVNFGATTVLSPTNTSQHITLYNPGYGFSITTGALNIVSQAVASIQCVGTTTHINGVLATTGGVSSTSWGYGGQAIRIDYDYTNWGFPVLVNNANVVGTASFLTLSFGDATYTAVRAWALNGAIGQVYAWYTPANAWTWANGASDIRLKSNIELAGKDALAAINSLSVIECDLTYPFPDAKPYHWNWAIVADEDLGAKIPSAYIPAGTDPETHAIIRELPVIAALVKAVQQLSARVEELER